MAFTIIIYRKDCRVGSGASCSTLKHTVSKNKKKVDLEMINEYQGQSIVSKRTVNIDLERLIVIGKGVVFNSEDHSLYQGVLDESNERGRCVTRKR